MSAENTPEQSDQVTLGDKNVETSNFDRFKGRKGAKDRIAILSKTLIRGFSFYHPGQQKSFRAPTNHEVLALAKAQLGEPTQKFGLVIFHYLTHPDTGDLLDATKCQGKVKLWVISETRYEELSGQHKQWPLLDNGFGQPQHDLNITCTEEKFQRMTIVPCSTAHWKSKQSWYDALKAKHDLAQPRVKAALGRVMTDLEIMEMLGATVPSQTGGTQNTADLDLSDALDP